MTKPKKILWSLLVGVLLIGGLLVPNQIFNRSKTAQAVSTSQKLTTEDVLIGINEIRKSNNLPKLKSNSLLIEAAKNKAQDMFDKQFFAHDGPTKKWSAYILETGYKYKLIGENLATGYYQPEQVTEAWMKSETHKKNILSPDFNETGIAIVYGIYQDKETVFIVQSFGESIKK